MLVIDLLENAALMVAVAAVFDLFALRLMHGSADRRMLVGVFFGLAAVLSMLNPVHFAPGVIFDGRTLILAAAGFMGGPAAAGAAAAVAAAYRLYLGGAGVIVGLLMIVTAAGLGALFSRLRRRGAVWERVPGLLLFAFSVHIVQFLIQLLLPAELRFEAMRAMAPVLLLAYPLMLGLILALFLQGERKNRAEEELRRSEERYRSLFDSSSAPMLLVDPEAGTIVEANRAARHFYGWREEEMRAMRYEQLTARREADTAALLREAQRTGMYFFELEHLRADGSIRRVAASSGTVRLRGREHVHLVIHDITPQRETEEQLHHLLAEKEALLREVHHRVKNNLAVMVSLLNLQIEESEGARSPEKALSKTRDRIIAMSSIHNLLYHSEDVARISFSEYLRTMTGELRTLYRLPEELRLELELEELFLEVDLAVPLGLIANEAVSNAVEHAFPEAEGGRVRVELGRDGGRLYSFRVRDNGRGIDHDGGQPASAALGIQLMDSLAKQLDGELSIRNEEGTVVELRFEVPENG